MLILPGKKNIYSCCILGSLTKILRLEINKKDKLKKRPFSYYVCIGKMKNLKIYNFLNQFNYILFYFHIFLINQIIKF